MTTNQNSQASSSFGTIVFTTNIPGDKEYTLDPTNISYSDEPDSKITKTTKKLYYHNDAIIKPNYLTNLTRSNVLNVLFNKNRFEQILQKEFDASGGLNSDEIIKTNIMTYIEHIFTTFPKNYNIKNINNSNKSSGIKFSLPYATIPYTYLKIDGTPHTVSRVVYYDDKQKDSISLEIINDYNEFEKWYPNQTKLKKNFADPLIKVFKKLFDPKMTKNNLSNTFGEGSGKRTFVEEIALLDKETEENDEAIKGIANENETINKNLKLPNENMIGEERTKYDAIKAWFKKNKIHEDTNFTNQINSDTNWDGVDPKNLTKKNGSINGNIVVDILKALQKIEDKNEKRKEKKYWLFDVGKEEKTLKTNNTKRKEIQKKNEGAIEKKKIYVNGKENGSYLIANIKTNLIGWKSKGTVESARTDEEMSTFSNAIDVIDEEYKNISNLNDDDILKDPVYKSVRNISDQLKQIKKPVTLSSSLFPGHKFKDIIELLDSFLTHSDIYTSFAQQMYDIELLNSKYSKYNEYKQYIDFIKKIKKIYEYNDEFKLIELQTMIANGDLVKVREDVGFENESIRLHIDLIKGKVDDTNVKQIACKYKDNDLVERWNGLDEIKDDNVKLEPMYYFKIDDTKSKDPKQMKKGGKKTRKRRRKKYVYTRKR